MLDLGVLSSEPVTRPLTPISPPNAGSAHEFEALVEPHLKQLWKTAYRFTGRREDAEDLLQDLLAQLYPLRQKLADVEALGPWLLRSLYHLFIDRRRSWGRNVLSQSDSDKGRLESIQSSTPGPEDAASADSVQKVVLKALATLDPDQRAVVVLHDIEGHTLAELQVQLDVPIGTLKSRLFRGRGKLRELLGGNLLTGADVFNG